MTGCIDMYAACIQAYVTNGTTPAITLKYITSGILGKNAFDGGYNIMAMGLLFHFIIYCFLFYGCFFYTTPQSKFFA
jgi:hypothetical protein